MMDRKYDVALSFAGEDRAYVDRVANDLKQARVEVFYDEFEQAELWGKDLFQHLDHIYRNQARYCVIFISRHYVQKVWAQHELKSAQARSLQERGEYILPVRLDDTEVPGVRPTVGYISGQSNTPEEIAALVVRKLGEGATPKTAGTRLPRVTPQEFDPVEYAPRIVEAVEKCFDSKKDELRSLGIRLSKTESRGGALLYRCLRGEEVLYFLQMRDDESIMGPGTITFGDGWGNPGVTGGATAHVRVEWDRERGEPVIAVSNYSLLDDMGNQKFTFSEFAGKVWEKACRIIESLSK